MPDHYYTQAPQSAHKPGRIAYEYRGVGLQFETDSGVFSRTEIDPGSDLLLHALPEEMEGSVLDMGCGYGVIGVAVGRVHPRCLVLMADVNERACLLAKTNAGQNGVGAQVVQSDGYAAIGPDRFAYILQNPPIRAGKTVIYEMFAQAARRLHPGGSLWLVIRRQQGAESAVRYLETLFTRVEVPLKKGGYWILLASEPKIIQGDETL